MTGPLPELGPLFDRLITIAAGETLDLGDIKVKPALLGK